MKKAGKGLGRGDALAACPVKAPVVASEHKDGKLQLTVEFGRPRWQRVLGADARGQRTFALDAYGQEIYALCDGKIAVREQVARFAKKHHISLPEAEVAVTTFLKTLMMKGLVGMAVRELPIADCRLPNERRRKAKD